MTYPGICDLELSQSVVLHVVLGVRVHDEVLVPNRASVRPVLVTLVSSHLLQFAQHHHYRGVVFPQHAPKVFSCLPYDNVEIDMRGQGKLFFSHT